MSEVHKPVEEQPAAAREATPTVEQVAETPAAEPVAVDAEAAPAAAEPVTEAEAKPETPKKEFEGQGVLGYKAPGGIIKKLAGFQKKFFWFGTDAVEVKSLSNYLRGEKPEVGNHNAAWSSQTGKGLLYFSKHAGEKTSPVGIINLADISDIKEDGTVDFTFVSHGQKHVLQASSSADRDAWVAALTAKSVEAKESVEAITGSDGYKEQLSSLSKPVATAAPVVGKVEEKKEEKAEAKEEEKEEKKARTKSRSASRKRNSIFGGFSLGGKKEEPVGKVEAKEEGKTEATPVEPVAAAPVETPVEPAAVAAPATEEPAATETAVEEPRPAASKRHSSIFDFKSRFGSKKSSTEAAPAVPAKDDEVVTSAEAPVIPAVEQSEPLAASIASPATVPTETVTNGESAAEATEVKAETKPEAKSDRRKSSLPFGFGQKKEKTTEVEGEKPLSPFAKLRQTVKHKTSPKAAEKAPEKAEEKTQDKPAEAEVPATEDKTEKAEEPVAAAPIQASTPVVSATA